MKTTIGKCSLCDGDVQLPKAWAGTVPPKPTCAKCGAAAKNPSAPVIPMSPAAPVKGFDVGLPSALFEVTCDS